MLGLYWGYIGTLSRSYFGLILGLSSNSNAVILGLYWAYIVFILGSCLIFLRRFVRFLSFSVLRPEH